MKRGFIKKLNAERGFGFVKPDDRSPDVFFHASSVEDHGFEQLKEGQNVLFETDGTNPEEGKGPRAKRVQPA